MKLIKVKTKYLLSAKCIYKKVIRKSYIQVNMYNKLSY